MFNVIEVNSIIERKSMLHLFREMAKNNHPDLSNILISNPVKIEDFFKNATIYEMANWRFIFEKINAYDMIPRCIDIALSINPVSSFDCMWLIKFYQEKGEEINSLPKVKEWLLDNPKDNFVRTAYLGLVERNGTQKQKKNTISDTEKWLSDNPKDNSVRTAYLGLVERNGTQKQKKNTISDTEKWLSDNPKDNFVRTAYLGFVERNGTQKQKENTISDTEKWLSENPDQANIWEVFLSYLIRENDLAKAIEIVELAIKSNPDNSNLLSIYIRLTKNILPPDEVKNLYTQLIDIIPGDINRKTDYVNWLRDHGYFIEAENLYKTLIDKNPKYSNPFYGYGCLLLKLERFEEASVKFRETLNINERHALAHDKLALSFIEREKFDEAKYELNNAIYWAKTQNGKLGIFYHDFGLLCLKLNHFEEAESHFKKSIHEEPQNFANYWHLGEACFFQKKYKIAEKSLLTALEKAPDDLGPPASEEIDKLLKQCKEKIQKYDISDNDNLIDQIVHDLNKKFSK